MYAFHDRILNNYKTMDDFYNFIPRIENISNSSFSCSILLQKSMLIII